jgi:FkbM family methyltransferase
LPALARACCQGGRVWAFEPNRENFRCAGITCKINGLENVRLMRAALSDAPGTRLLQTKDIQGRALGGASKVFSRRRGGANDVETVRAVTIDDVVPADRCVSVVHLDVEGQEAPALIGGLRTIQRCRPVIIVETLPPQDWLQAHLFPIGYRIGARIHGNTVLEVVRP